MEIQASEGPVAFRILERLVLGRNGPLWTRTCALLSPSHDSLTQRILRSLENQAEKRGLTPVLWTEELSEEQECAAVLAALGFENPDEHDLIWDGPTQHTPLAAEVARRVEKLTRIRGLERITRGSVAYVARRMMHTLRTRSHYQGKRIVTTVRKT